MTHLIAADIHPLNNLRVMQSLRKKFSATADQVQDWASRWITNGFTALGEMVSVHGGAFSFGDQPSLADCTLVPQVYSADRFCVDLESFTIFAVSPQQLWRSAR